MRNTRRFNISKARQSVLLIAAAATVWGVATAAGLGTLVAFERTPGRGAESGKMWPAWSALDRVAGKATLVMAVHPNCPCSRASLGELSIVMEHFSKQMTAYVLFVGVPGMGQDPAMSGLWKTASEIPGVRVVRDEKGIATGDFGAKTSGQVYFFDVDGRLRFEGGITASRGHAGENDGVAAIESLLSTGVSGRTTTPVYGCSLR